ncbi:MAG: MFS transporter [Rhodobacteraceae bacterium]|nr:MFS transporter [Paracoccaceae bacterium]
MAALSSTRAFLFENAPWLSAGAVLTLLSSFGQTFFISLFAGHIRMEFGLSHGDWDLIYSIGTTASAIVMVWAGGLADTYRVRTLGQADLLALALACLMMAFNVWAAVLPLVIFCLRLTGQGMAHHIAVVAMGRWFVATRGKALAIATLGFAFGEAVLPIVFVALMGILHWQTLWIIAAGIALLGIPVLRRCLVSERTPASIAQDVAVTGMKNRHWTRIDALRHPLVWFMVPALLAPSAFNTAFFFHQVHFAETKEVTHLALVAYFPIYTGVSILGMIASGAALDRWGTARLLPYSQIPMVAAFLIFAMAQDGIGFFLGFFAMALTTGANSTLPNAFWAEFYGTRYLGSIKAMATAIMVLGSAIGPGVTGLLIDLGVGIETQFVWIAGVFLITTFSMIIGINRYKTA